MKQKTATRRRTHFVPRVVFERAFAGVVPLCVAASCGGSSGSPGTSEDAAADHATMFMGVAAACFVNGVQVPSQCCYNGSGGADCPDANAQDGSGPSRDADVPDAKHRLADAAADATPDQSVQFMGVAAACFMNGRLVSETCCVTANAPGCPGAPDGAVSDAAVHDGAPTDGAPSDATRDAPMILAVAVAAFTNRMDGG